MKIFANKKIWKRLVIILLFITVFSFVTPKSVFADDDDTTIGGTLMKPICNLLVGLCDGVVNLLHRFIVGEDDTLVRINLTSGFWRKSIYYITGCGSSSTSNNRRRSWFSCWNRWVYSCGGIFRDRNNSWR